MQIAFFGPPGSGKTTISQAMIELHGGAKIAFADALRAEVSKVYEIPLPDLQNAPTKYQYRKLLQDYGNGKRAEDPSHWVQAWLALYEAREATNVFVDDVRFPNEYQALKTLGFTFIKLGLNLLNPEVRASEEELKDVSERHWPSFAFDASLTWDHTPIERAKRLDIIMKNLPAPTHIGVDNA